MFEGFYQGQWSNGLRHGYGIRQSATHAEHTRSRDEFRSRFAGRQPVPAGGFDRAALILADRDDRTEVGGGFVLTDDVTASNAGHRRFWTSLRSLSKTGATSSSSSPPATGFSRRFFGARGSSEERSRSTDYHETRPDGVAVPGSKPSSLHRSDPGDDTWSVCGDHHRVQVPDGGLTEAYSGEWKQDRRCGFGVCQRSDGLKYEGEWANNRKSGYGRTTFPDGGRLEGKYRNDVLVSSASKSSGRGVKFMSASLNQKVESAVTEAQAAVDKARHQAEISSIR